MKLNAKKARLVMELRNAGITDTAVIRAIELTPREQFVLETFRDRAYDNTALPIDEGQTISQPLVVAMMTEALELNDRQKVLEIGTGSGYQTAVLSRLCRRVYTVERHRSLLKQAEARFEALRIRNVTARSSDGWKGWPEQAPFDRIIVTAGAEELPPALVEQLAVGGIMVIPVGPSGAQQLLKVDRTEGGVRSHVLGDVRFVPLVRADGGGEANGFARNGSAN